MSVKTYNPYKMFVGAFIPNWLLERPEISSGAKLCFARLAQYAGEKGEAFPSQETLGKELGVSERNARRYLKELEDNQIIQSVRKGLGQSNTYRFLVHKWMETNRTDMSSKRGQKRPINEDKFDLSDRTSLTSLTGQICPAATLEENHIRESGKRIKRKAEEPSFKNEGSLCQSKPEPAPDIPQWVSRETWDEYLKIRASLKTPNTARALSMILKRLSEFKSHGHDPNAILEDSIMNGWKGVFEPKTNGKGQFANHPAVKSGMLSENAAITAENIRKLIEKGELNL